MENLNTQFTLNNFFPKIVPFMDNMENYCTSRQAADDNKKWHMRIVCWITEATDTHSGYVIIIVFHGNSGYVKALQSYVYT
jgi:hypothetical protein